MECRHGRQPFDPCPSPDGQWPRTEPCGCFPVEAEGYVAPVVPLPVKRPKPVLRSPDGLCGCGCGAPVRRRFLQGHNSKVAA